MSPQSDCRRVLPIPLFALGLAMSGCVVSHPSLDTPGAFALRLQGHVNNQVAPRLLDCISDGWKGIEQSSLFNHTTTQERRSLAYRVQLRGALDPGHILLSADIYDDGRYRIVELNDTLQIGNENLRREGLTIASACAARVDR
jgi:hypothetical protein